MFGFFGAAGLCNARRTQSDCHIGFQQRKRDSNQALLQQGAQYRKNFIALANSGFYDATPVHRIEEYLSYKWVSRHQTRRQQCRVYIKGEFRTTNLRKTICHMKQGWLPWPELSEHRARKGLYNSASTQFFYHADQQPNLDGITRYSAGHPRYGLRSKDFEDVCL